MRRKLTEFVSNMISTHYFIIITIIITIITIMISVIIIISSSSSIIIIVMNIIIIVIAIISFFKNIICTMAIIVVIIVGQWRGTLMLSFIWAWTNGWANHQAASDLRRHRAYYVMCFWDRRHDQMNQYNSEGRISWNMMKCFTDPFLNEWSCNISTFIIFAFLQRPGEWLVGTLSIGKLFKIHNLWLRPAKSHETCIRNCVN